MASISPAQRLESNLKAVNAFNDHIQLWDAPLYFDKTFCKTSYMSGGNTIKESLEIHIFKTGSQKGKVVLNEWKKIRPDTVITLAFHPSRYSFTFFNNELVIEGTSKKVKFKVVIGEFDSSMAMENSNMV